MKNIILMILAGIFMTGCSAKYPNMKKGAMIGATTGAITVVALGAEQMSGHNSPLVVMGAVILALVGLLVGGGIGYVMDSAQEEKNMQGMRESQYSVEFK
ncbi:MAG: hypothetical protein U9N11_01645 [Campylobacterota bacterium]|nr:hypothetical protein [Campylobacterota bacterium]